LLLKQFTVKFLLWIVYLPDSSVDYFHKNFERKVSVVIQLLCSAIYIGLVQLFNIVSK